MSRGLGHVERSIMVLLEANPVLTAPEIAALVYATDEEQNAGRILSSSTNAQLSAVRRALLGLRRRGLVVKLGHMFQGQRCSYARHDIAVSIAKDYIRSFDQASLRHHPELAEALVDDVLHKCPSERR